MKKIKTLGITGSTGFVGANITGYLKSKNYDIVIFSRNPKSVDKNKERKISLKEKSADFFGLDCIIHCAWDFSVRGLKNNIAFNAQGTIALMKKAKSDGIKKQIFISSLSAFEGCKSNYGKAKMIVEDYCKNNNITIIRPGLIYSEDSRGMMGFIEKLSRKSPVILLPGNGREKQYMCHTSDLSEMIIKVLDYEGSIGVKKPLIAGNEHGINPKAIIRITIKKLGIADNRIYINIPAFFILTPLRIAELLGLKLRLSSDSLVGLVNYNNNIDFSENKKIRMHFRVYGGN